MERRVAIPPGRVTHSRDGPVHKGEATIRVRRIRRCALHTSTEITGPSLRKSFYLCDNWSLSWALASPWQWPGRQSTKRELERSFWFFWRSRKNILSAALYMLSSSQRLPAGKPSGAPRTQPSRGRGKNARSRGHCSASALRRKTAAGCRMRFGGPAGGRLQSWKGGEAEKENRFVRKKLTG